MPLTKILKSDLSVDLQQLIEDLRNARGTFPSLSDRLDGPSVLLKNLDSSIQDVIKDLQMAKDTTGQEMSIRMTNMENKEVIVDLENAKTASGKDMSTRVSDLESEVSSLSSASGTVGLKTVGEPQLTDALLAEIHAVSERGNYTEQYTYDDYGNVTSVTVTGDFAYTVTYTYSDPVNGILQQSVKTLIEDGKTVTVTKTYTYDSTNTNITAVSTTTTIS
ncbi:hypothetical protein [Alicyclobacillus shizuokensis]|uniref:hypothetical protein n=1 Tax=Alicyclobacillus shizuokensis TaxID=392014 RepID=UPI00083006E3|nr:hypothetical protein [Alicyclobacillus shizuokensis]